MGQDMEGAQPCREPCVDESSPQKKEQKDKN